MRVMKRLETKSRGDLVEKENDNANSKNKSNGKANAGIECTKSEINKKDSVRARSMADKFEEFLLSAGASEESFLTENLLDCSKSIAEDAIKKYRFAFEPIGELGKIIDSVIENLDKSEFLALDKDIFVHKTATVDPTAHLGHGLVIDAGAEIRHSAYIRGNCIVGKNSVVGNSVELKNAILFDEAKVPHFNYVGDSILGYRSHMGAGAIVSNFKADGGAVNISLGKKKFCTGFRKFGAILGDCAEIGCNCVLNPGTIIGKNSNVYPTTSVRGVIESGVIVKSMNNIVRKK